MTIIAPHNERLLFADLAKGDHAAFTQLFHHYTPRLFPFVIRITKSEAIAEEIIQEVFLRLWVNRSSVGDYEQPGAWLFLIASNLSMTHLRNAANMATKHEQSYVNKNLNDESLTLIMDGKEMESFLEEAVKQLPPKRQQIFRMSRQQGLNHQEIATQLSLSSNTVKDHMVLALKFIRDYLKQKSGISIGIVMLTKIL